MNFEKKNTKKRNSEFDEITCNINCDPNYVIKTNFI